MEISLSPSLISRLKEWTEDLEGVDLEEFIPLLLEKALEVDPLMDEVMEHFS